MVPTLEPGDRLLVDLEAYRSASPVIGDIVVLRDPEKAERWLVKRVAGVGPGQFWRTGSGLVSVPSEDAIEEISLPASTVYVTGDAESARDSRRFGPVPSGSLVGRAYYRYAPAHRRGEL